jgi:Protein of unknown function (DUF1826)
MISYRLPIDRTRATTAHLSFNDVDFKTSTLTKTTAFNPLEMLDIFEQDRQIKVVERPVDTNITQYLLAVSEQLNHGFKYVVQANQALSSKLLGDRALPELAGRDSLLSDLDELCDLYLDLIGCPEIGVRLEVLNTAMCPKFHIDRTGIRMLCTYVGPGTQWLDDQYADRSKLGMASVHTLDSDSGLIKHPKGIHEVPNFAIALLKGSAWQGNQSRGIIHRSPAVLAHQTRILMSIDAIW